MRASARTLKTVGSWVGTAAASAPSPAPKPCHSAAEEGMHSSSWPAKWALRTAPQVAKSASWNCATGVATATAADAAMRPGLGSTTEGLAPASRSSTAGFQSASLAPRRLAPLQAILAETQRALRRAPA